MARLSPIAMCLLLMSCSFMPNTKGAEHASDMPAVIPPPTPSQTSESNNNSRYIQIKARSGMSVEVGQTIDFDVDSSGTVDWKVSSEDGVIDSNGTLRSSRVGKILIAAEASGLRATALIASFEKDIDVKNVNIPNGYSASLNYDAIDGFHFFYSQSELNKFLSDYLERVAPETSSYPQIDFNESCILAFVFDQSWNEYSPVIVDIRSNALAEVRVVIPRIVDAGVGTIDASISNRLHLFELPRSVNGYTGVVL